MDGEKAMAALTNPELVSTYEEEVREAVRKGKQLYILYVHTVEPLSKDTPDIRKLLNEDTFFNTCSTSKLRTPH